MFGITQHLISTDPSNQKTCRQCRCQQSMR
ncbi:Uncharacterised protein [Vibrio cholerae]|nr:Uncharacterised protein [Vibrio cholerae]